MRFRYKFQHLIVLYNCRTVISFGLCPTGIPTATLHIAVDSFLRYFHSTVHRPIKQSVLKEQVPTGIICYAKPVGTQRPLRPSLHLFSKLTDYFIHIGFNVCHLYLRGAGGDLYKTVFHKNKLFTKLSLLSYTIFL